MIGDLACSGTMLIFSIGDRAMIKGLVSRPGSVINLKGQTHSQDE